MIVGVGSPSAAKVGAVELAFAELGLSVPAVRGYDIQTTFTRGQIWTNHHRFLGAALRSIGVSVGPDTVDLAIGIESGLYAPNQGISAFHYTTDVVILDCRKKTWCSATTQSMSVPLELVGELGRGPQARDDVQPTDIGRLVRTKHGGVPGGSKDVVAHLTGGRHTRAGFVAHTIATMLRVASDNSVELRCSAPLQELKDALHT